MNKIVRKSHSRSILAKIKNAKNQLLSLDSKEMRHLGIEPRAHRGCIPTLATMNFTTKPMAPGCLPDSQGLIKTYNPFIVARIGIHHDYGPNRQPWGPLRPKQSSGKEYGLPKLR